MNTNVNNEMTANTNDNATNLIDFLRGASYRASHVHNKRSGGYTDLLQERLYRFADDSHVLVICKTICLPDRSYDELHLQHMTKAEAEAWYARLKENHESVDYGFDDDDFDDDDGLY